MSINLDPKPGTDFGGYTHTAKDNEIISERWQQLVHFMLGAERPYGLSWDREGKKNILL